MRLKHFLLICGLTAGPGSTFVKGQPSSRPSVAISQPGHGFELAEGAAFYDIANQTVHVLGVVEVPPGKASDYVVLVNGFSAPIAGGCCFDVEIPIGPAPPAGMGFWPSWLPYASFFTDQHHIQKPILAELVHVPTWTTAARTRIVLFDKRQDGEIESQYGGKAISRSLGFELTWSGLDALEQTHVSSLPQPSLARFNEDLAGNFSGQVRVHNPVTEYANPEKACVDLASVKNIRATAAYRDILVEAGLLHTSYHAAKQICEGADPTDLINLVPGLGLVASGLVTFAACEYADQSCVKELPRDKHFEVCAAEIRGVSEDLRMEGIDSVDLALNDDAVVDARTRTLRLDGTVDGALRRLLIRWSVDHQGCMLRPQARVSDNEVTGTPGLNTWASCPALEVDAILARTDDHQSYAVRPGRIPETLRVEASSRLDPVFSLDDGELVNTGAGTCGEEAFRGHVETMLKEFHDPMRAALDATWEQGYPRTQQARALDLLFSRFQTGVFGDSLTVDLRYEMPFENLDGTADRIQGALGSDVKLNTGFGQFKQPTFVYSPPVIFPCGPGAMLPGGAACSGDRGYFGNPFHVSYSVTTGALNQVLRERYPTALLFSTLEPGCNDLNLPAGCDPNDRPPLHALTLGNLHPAFGSISSPNVSILMRPTMLPFTWIPPDPQPQQPPIQDGRAPLTYQMSQYEIQFIGDTNGPDGTNVWLRVLLDFYDPDFEMNIAPERDNNRLIPGYSGRPQWDFTIVSSQLAGCPLVPKTMPPPGPPPSPCEAGVTAAVQGLVRPLMEERMLAMLQGFPAPKHFDAMGKAPWDVRFSQADKFQWGQVITYYGRLER
ncbi:MAG: hypothetical protein KIT09_08115 [Bryobacteraceae bacterium]|nr:hypothetical protein [Bryobacteraceae bacterium]